MSRLLVMALYTTFYVYCYFKKLNSYVSVKSKLEHAPPGNPSGIWLFWKFLFKFPPTRAKMPFKCPTLGSIFRWSNALTQATFHRHKNDRRTAETPSVVEQNLYKYNKNWETLLAYLLRTKVSRAKRRKSLLQSHWRLSFFLCHAPYKAVFKKNPTYWDYF